MSIIYLPRITVKIHKFSISWIKWQFSRVSTLEIIRFLFFESKKCPVGYCPDPELPTAMQKRTENKFQHANYELINVSHHAEKRRQRNKYCKTCSIQIYRLIVGSSLYMSLACTCTRFNKTISCPQRWMKYYVQELFEGYVMYNIIK